MSWRLGGGVGGGGGGGVPYIRGGTEKAGNEGLMADESFLHLKKTKTKFIEERSIFSNRTRTIDKIAYYREGEGGWCNRMSFQGKVGLHSISGYASDKTARGDRPGFDIIKSERKRPNRDGGWAASTGVEGNRIRPRRKRDNDP